MRRAVGIVVGLMCVNAVASGQVLWVGSERDGVYSYESQTGAFERVLTTRDAWSLSGTGLADQVFAARHNGKLALLDLSSGTVDPRGGRYSSDSLGRGLAGQLYAGSSQDGTVFAIDSADGTATAIGSFGSGGVLGDLAVGSDGLIYVVTRAGAVMALDVSDGGAAVVFDLSERGVSGTVSGLAFESDQAAWVSAGSVLYSVLLSTGEVTEVGDLGVTITDLGSDAFGRFDGLGAVPTPASGVVVGLGGLTFAGRRR